ncbi:hypothetical protein [Mangrovimonas futianensis]|uniref:hypothetical protein n=1 Tax=Mangrovimonas futianensis TaxID=2895523 RepID=UPI001E2F8FE5|nr:hypothetical protein [Mangrovimonas futianensis]MCF1421040.1 hypothetical protein [Mangrovimonas futianensis]
MIDYTKILILGVDTDRLLNLPYLDFKSELNERTGELSTFKTAIYHTCKIRVFDSGIVIFSGSIHKLHNSLNNLPKNCYKRFTEKGYNANLFTIKEIFEIRERLQQLFKVPLKNMLFQNIEFGVNIITVFNPNEFLRGLLMHNGKPFEFRYNDHYAQVKHQRYIIKVYNKSHLYNMPFNVIRLEIKLMKAIEIIKTGIKTFEDVNNNTLINALNLLEKRINETVYFDHTINQDNNKWIDKYSNKKFWLYELKPNRRHKHKKQLETLNNLHSLNLKKQLINRIKLKSVKINSSKYMVKYYT